MYTRGRVGMGMGYLVTHIPDSFHVVPVGDYPMLYGVTNVQQSSMLLYEINAAMSGHMTTNR